MNYNHVCLVGRLPRDPELRYTSSGTAIARFALAINHVYTSSSGEKREETSFIDCSAFGRQAEAMGQYLKKGDEALVSGRLKQETWDGKDGQRRSKIIVQAESIQFGAKAGGRSGEARTEPEGPVRGDGRTPPFPTAEDDDTPL